MTQSNNNAGLTANTKNSLSYYSEEACNLADFISLVDRKIEKSDLSYTAKVEKNIPIYDMSELSPLLVHTEQRQTLLSEWANLTMNGSGVLVIKNSCRDLSVIDRATEVYNKIIAREKAESESGGDHFAAAGNNDRIWNSLQKLCEEDPEVFALYFSNPVLKAICEAWVGPNYQMTSQVNLVRPGGAAQDAHRDYHLGFQTAELAGQYPTHVHGLSAILTFQGALAHCDIPLESGPTKLLPFSQTYPEGYMAWRREDFRSYFEEHHVQLPLEKGDLLFFNPALFHAAGSNYSTDIHRMVNLFQVSSPFGRAMETVNRKAMSSHLYPTLKRLKNDKVLNQMEIIASVASCAEGYPFPTNLDRDPPVGGLAPESQQELFLRALSEDWSPNQFNQALEEQAAKKNA